MEREDIKLKLVDALRSNNVEAVKEELAKLSERRRQEFLKNALEMYSKSGEDYCFWSHVTGLDVTMVDAQTKIEHGSKRSVTQEGPFLHEEFKSLRDASNVLCQVCTTDRCVDDWKTNREYFIQLTFHEDSDFENYIRALGKKLAIPDEIIEEACQTFIRQKRKGTSDLYTALGSLYAVTRSTKCIPIDLNSFARASMEVPCLNWHTSEPFAKEKQWRKSIAREYRRIMLKLEKKPKVCYTNPKIFALNYARKLHYTPDAKHIVEKLCDETIAKKLHLGRDPKVIAAIICYIVAIISGNQQTTQRDIAELAGITDATMHSYRELARRLGLTTERIKGHAFKVILGEKKID